LDFVLSQTNLIGKRSGNSTKGANRDHRSWSAQSLATATPPAGGQWRNVGLLGRARITVLGDRVQPLTSRRRLEAIIRPPSNRRGNTGPVLATLQFTLLGQTAGRMIAVFRFIGQGGDPSPIPADSKFSDDGSPAGGHRSDPSGPGPIGLASKGGSGRRQGNHHHFRRRSSAWQSSRGIDWHPFPCGR
jgi:hypothetical protein